MKKCPNNHENPDNANYCRLCGYEFQPLAEGQIGNEEKLLQEIDMLNKKEKKLLQEIDMLNNKIRLLEEKIHNSMGGKINPPKPSSHSKFTPDLFPGINLTPYSVNKIDFKCRKVLFFIFFLIATFIVIRHFRWQIMEFAEYRQVPMIIYKIIPAMPFIVAALLLYSYVALLKRFRNWSDFKKNADYIESSTFVRNYFRIAKNGKLGLFDKNTNCVMLESHYDKITKFDNYHILIEKDGLKGLFSMNKMFIIVPVQYNNIEQFKNSVTKCQNKTEVAFYDVNGNRMK